MSSIWLLLRWRCQHWDALQMAFFVDIAGLPARWAIGKGSRRSVVQLKIATRPLCTKGTTALTHILLSSWIRWFVAHGVQRARALEWKKTHSLYGHTTLNSFNYRFKCERWRLSSECSKQRGSVQMTSACLCLVLEDWARVSLDGSKWMFQSWKHVKISPRKSLWNCVRCLELTKYL